MGLTVKWSALPHHTLLLCVSLTTGPETVESANHRVKPQKPWTKINLSSFKLFLSGIIATISMTSSHPRFWHSYLLRVSHWIQHLLRGWDPQGCEHLGIKRGLHALPCSHQSHSPPRLIAFSWGGIASILPEVTEGMALNYDYSYSWVCCLEPQELSSMNSASFYSGQASTKVLGGCQLELGGGHFQKCWAGGERVSKYNLKLGAALMLLSSLGWHSENDDTQRMVPWHAEYFELKERDCTARLLWPFSSSAEFLPSVFPHLIRPLLSKWISM